MSDFRRRLFSILSLIALAVVPLGLAHAQVSVTAADPSSTVQGTVSLDVTVAGSGFNSTASVKFLVTGTADPGGIVVKKVVVSSAKKLVATIDVADTAVVNKFDIEVALSSGRKGKGTTLFAVQAKGKPTPPPPPPPDTTSCVAAPGVFPALVWSKPRYTTVKKGGGTQVYDGSDLYIADSTGTCSILIYPGSKAFSAGTGSYRQIGNKGRIAYIATANTEIRLLDFTVTNGKVDGLPLSTPVVHTYNLPFSGINDVELSHDGKTIYFAEEHLTADSRWVTTVNSLDVSTNCSPACPKTVVYESFPDDSGVAGLSIKGNEDRLYMAIHFRVPDIRTVSFLEKQGDGSWAFRNVVSDQDTRYLSVAGFANTVSGTWDYDSSGVPKDVVAYVVEYPTGDTTDIIDVSNCIAAPVGGGSCLASGESNVVRFGIPGFVSSITSTPSSPTDVGPNLLVVGGGWISDVDLGVPTSAPVQFLQGGGGESAD